MLHLSSLVDSVLTRVAGVQRQVLDSLSLKPTLMSSCDADMTTTSLKTVRYSKSYGVCICDVHCVPQVMLPLETPILILTCGFIC